MYGGIIIVLDALIEEVVGVVVEGWGRLRFVKDMHRNQSHLDCEEGVIRLGSVTPGEAIVGCGESSTESSSR